jgi:integrase
LAHNRERVGVFCRDFGHRKPKTITRTEARLWATGGIAPPGLKGVQNWEGATVNPDGEITVPPHRSAVPAVRAMFNDMVEDEHVDLDKNVFNNLRLEQSKGRSQAIMLTEGELDRLIRIARNLHGQGWASMIQFAAWTGLRPAELYALRRRDFGWEERVVRVRRQYRSKTDEEVTYLKTDAAQRDVPLLPPAVEAVDQLPRRLDGEDLVFTTKTGQRFTARTQVWYWAQTRAAFWEGLDEDRKCSLCVREMGKDADWGPAKRGHEIHDGIPPDFAMYELRHWFASYMAQLPGVTPMDVAKYMGHADKGQLAMERYFHTETAAALERAHAGYERMLRDEQERAEQGRKAI